jgi:ABC-type multidrug transport system ATPase subunit
MNHRMQVDSVRMHFGHRLILGDVAMDCKSGDIVGLFGRNGSGKSTLLNIIAGTLPADELYLRINDEVVIGRTRHMRYICYLPQGHYIPPHFTIENAISLSLSKKGLYLLKNDPVLQPVIKNRIKDLSGGERRYLEIMLVLNHSAAFVLMDEPFNGLSPLLKELVCQKIIEASVTKGFIITDHNYEYVIKICNRKLLLKEGFLKAIENISDLADAGYFTKE